MNPGVQAPEYNPEEIQRNIPEGIHETILKKKSLKELRDTI